MNEASLSESCVSPAASEDAIVADIEKKLDGKFSTKALQQALEEGLQKYMGQPLTPARTAEIQVRVAAAAQTIVEARWPGAQVSVELVPHEGNMEAKINIALP